MIAIRHCTQGGDDLQFVVAVAYLENCMTVGLNLINHVLALFRDKFACNSALRNPVFRWESCKGSV